MAESWGSQLPCRESRGRGGGPDRDRETLSMREQQGTLVLQAGLACLNDVPGRRACSGTPCRIQGRSSAVRSHPHRKDLPKNPAGAPPGVVKPRIN